MTARKRTYSEAVRRRAEQLIRNGRTQRDTQATLAREFGSSPSLGWLGNLGKAVSLDRQARVSEQPPAGGEQASTADEQATPEASGSPSSPGAPPAPPPSADEQAEGVLDLPRLIGLLEQASADVARASAQARVDGDLAGVARAARSLVGLTESLRRLAPTPPPNIEDNPDMVAAAEKCRAKLHELLDRARARLEEQPKCPACGRPIAPKDPVELLTSLERTAPERSATP